MITSEMMADQLKFFIGKCGDPDIMMQSEREAWTKEFCLQLAVEAFEAMDKVNWKHHRPSVKPVDCEALLAELVDCSRFLLNLLIVWQVSEDEFKAAWDKKMALTISRPEPSTPDVVARLDRSELEDLVRKLTVDLRYGSAQEENDRCVSWLRSNGHDTIAEVIEEGFNRRVVEG